MKKILALSWLLMLIFTGCTTGTGSDLTGFCERMNTFPELEAISPEDFYIDSSQNTLWTHIPSASSPSGVYVRALYDSEYRLTELHVTLPEDANDGLTTSAKHILIAFSGDSEEIIDAALSPDSAEEPPDASGTFVTHTESSDYTVTVTELGTVITCLKKTVN